MNISLDCIPCYLNNFLRLLKKELVPVEQHEKAMREVLNHLSGIDFQQSPPSLGRETQQLLRDFLNDPDPYADIKKMSNKIMLDEWDRFERLVAESDDPFTTALRLAIAGNVIDYGSQHQFDIWQSIERVLNVDLAIDDTELLRRDVAASKQLLYIGDNCGEIVMDKLFLQTLSHSNAYFVVRGAPTLNDATLNDAYDLGIDKLARIITTGDDAPGAVWETASQEFKDLLRASDVVIAKGQGNLEGLIDVDHNIYFLFVAKCDVIAARVGAAPGDFIVQQSQIQTREALL